MTSPGTLGKKHQARDGVFTASIGPHLPAGELSFFTTTVHTLTFTAN
jgi:hypothetical protein